jgi:DNA-binding transcriptional ArsR family regulator
MYHLFMKQSSGIVKQSSQASVPRWDFLTNHAHVLVCVAHDSGIRLRDIAAAVGITERAAHRILSELVEEGYVLRERQGRRNRYQVKPELPLRHPLVQEREVGELLKVLSEGKQVANRREAGRPPAKLSVGGSRTLLRRGDQRVSATARPPPVFAPSRSEAAAVPRETVSCSWAWDVHARPRPPPRCSVTRSPPSAGLRVLRGS